MRLEFGNKPVTFRPVSLVLETQQELDDIQWLVGMNITIPEAVAKYYGEDKAKRAYKILGTIFGAIQDALLTKEK